MSLCRLYLLASVLGICGARHYFFEVSEKGWFLSSAPSVAEVHVHCAVKKKVSVLFENVTTVFVDVPVSVI